jgi:hypothetical protein
MPTRFRRHATARSPLITAFSPLQSRSLTTAGLRQPLLIASQTPLQKCVSCWCNGCVHHGWLTPAALGARCSFAAKALFAMDKRTFTGAAGVSPPWLDEPDAVPRESNIVQRLASTRSGAPGVSPPWLGNVLAVMNAVCERERSPTTAGSRQPLLIASQTPLHKCVSCRCSGCVHHGWLTPAALGARCSFAAKALFAMDKRTFTGAVGVSLPWLAEMHLHGRYRKHAENCYRWVGRRRCHRGRSVRGSTRTMRSNTAKRHCRPGRLPSHGGLTSPALGCTCVCTSQKSPFHRHTFRPHQERGSNAGGDVAANNVLRFESGGH